MALKVLPQALTTDSQALQRFEREARAIAALNPPNICTVHDVGEGPGGTRFIVMELLEGETLRDRLDRRPLESAALVDMAIALAGGLDAAHRRGIVHRDIKPSNIFLTPHGPKLLDFGLALPSTLLTTTGASQASTIGALTEVGSTVGTIAYMSPEQLRAEPLDARTDLFSLGAVLYEMAVGRPAYTSAVIANAILEKTPPPILLRKGATLAGLARIVGRALEQDRELRHQSAADLRSDLERLGRDVRTSSVDAGHRPLRRRTLAVGTIVAAVVLGLSGVAYRFLTSASGITSLAVLPFTHDSSQPDTEYLSNAITENLINNLSQSGVRVLVTKHRPPL